MATMAGRADPYQTLGIDPSASEVELRTAYRRAVQRHHPDHNNGSAESARRFEEVQEAYAEIRRRRAAGAGPQPRRSAPGPAPGGSPPPDPDLEARLAKIERELKAAARDARDRAVRAAREAQEQAVREARASSAGRPRPDRPTDEELGYYSTEDSFSKILDDAAAELSGRWSEARRSPAAHRVSDLIDDLAAKLTGEHHKRD